jgi:hypothetical protein
MVAVPHFWRIPISLGLCVPSVCRIEDFEDYKAYVVKAINAALPTVFRDIKGIDAEKQIKAKYVHFYKSKDLNEMETEVDFGAGIIIFFFVLLLVLLCSGTGYQIYQKRKLANQIDPA